MLERVTGKQFPETKDPVPPASALYLLEHFYELGTTRRYSENGGMSAITYQEIYAYQELMEYAFEPWEVEVIKHLDRVFISEVYEQRRSDND